MAEGCRAPFGRSVTALSHLLLPSAPLGANTRCSRCSARPGWGRLRAAFREVGSKGATQQSPAARPRGRDRGRARCALPAPGLGRRRCVPACCADGVRCRSGGVPRISQPRCCQQAGTSPPRPSGSSSRYRRARAAPPRPRSAHTALHRRRRAPGTGLGAGSPGRGGRAGTGLSPAGIGHAARGGRGGAGNPWAGSPGALRESQGRDRDRDPVAARDARCSEGRGAGMPGGSCGARAALPDSPRGSGAMLGAEQPRVSLGSGTPGAPLLRRRAGAPREVREARGHRAGVSGGHTATPEAVGCAWGRRIRGAEIRRVRSAGAPRALPRAAAPPRCRPERGAPPLAERSGGRRAGRAPAAPASLLPLVSRHVRQRSRAVFDTRTRDAGAVTSGTARRADAGTAAGAGGRDAAHVAPGAVRSAQGLRASSRAG